MTTKRLLATSTLATSTLAASTLAACLLGVGMGTAAADPGRPCNGPGNGACQPAPAPNQGPGNQRGIDQGRQDHQPFNYQGQHVTPLPAGNGAGWGFWFLGRWVAL